MKLSGAIILSLLIILPAELVFVAWHRSSRLSERHALVAAGDVCVDYRDTWLGPEINRHWPGRTAYGRVYCDKRDYPPGENENNVGQLQLPEGGLSWWTRPR